MEIKFIEPIRNEKAIEDFFEKLEIPIPDKFNSFFLENNGGMLIDQQCTLLNGNEKILNAFLSFNEEDIENVYEARICVAEDNLKLVPFANDPFGNFFCLRDGSVIFYSHEDGEEYEICDSFDTFIKKLY